MITASVEMMIVQQRGLVFGCREVGVPCKNNDGIEGNCNGNHECVQSGEAWLTKLTIETRDCKDCSTLKAASGASIRMTVVPPGGEKSCTTHTLDDPAAEDYAVGQATFEDPTYLSTCFMFGLSDKVTDFKVTWTGAGTWTPEKFILERRKGADWPFCCYNEGGLTLTEGQEQTFTCIESDASIGSGC
eukprot:TRINITY_DN36071_c0_g1_i1.p1 TRINITY_DN36071_c0_g1~~TRINITY_DN36071_c0_g1_i1.p1  ORF type:complete len:188 (-),score=58.10 TRINITY_DN36071_c0_g1_i1:213-776(-)